MFFKILSITGFLVLIIYFIWLRFINVLYLKRIFKRLSVILCGKRGYGKDTIFSFLSYRKKHNSNIPLQKNTNLITVKDLGIPNLTRESLLNYTFKPLNRSNFKHFDNITFISDAGIFFPNWDDMNLKKNYSNIPLTWSIWRHLYDNGCHFNIQKFGRLWKLLREQAEDVIEIQDFNRGLIYSKIKMIHYSDIKDCELSLKPLKKNFHIFKRSDIVDIENSKRGDIKEFTVLIPNYKINHNSRYFKKIIFEED